uniref:Uncharacterized protein n=1 Tax=Cacopsylla melanoneura TaxID=428564 RepID=A0A8D9B915_9HEMI
MSLKNTDKGLRLFDIIERYQNGESNVRTPKKKKLTLKNRKSASRPPGHIIHVQTASRSFLYCQNCLVKGIFVFNLLKSVVRQSKYMYIMYFLADLLRGYSPKK